jgi:hypothetical protein
VTLDQALTALANHPHISRYKYLVSDENPDTASREAYKQTVIDRAQGKVREHRAVDSPPTELGTLVAAHRCCGGVPMPD